MDLRLLHLDDRTPGVGQVVELLVEGVAEGHDSRRNVLVVLVLHRKCDELRRHRAELDRLGGEPLRGLQQLRVLHLAPADGPDHLGHDARFEVVVKDVASRERDAAGAHFGELRVRCLEAGHVVGRVAGPALAADVLVEATVTVGDDVEPRHLLLPQVGGQGIHVLFTEARRHHRIEE